MQSVLLIRGRRNVCMLGDFIQWHAPEVVLSKIAGGVGFTFPQ